MSNALAKYVQENYARASSIEISSWLSENTLPVICEPKYDGIRVFLFKSGEQLVVVGKIGSVFTPAGNPKVFSKVPELVRAPHRMILDGEYVSRDGLHFFDILQIDDRGMKPLPLYRRKEILHAVIQDSGLETPFIWAETSEDIQQFAKEEISSGAEGIMVKNRNSFYGDPGAWTRIKRFDTVDCVVIDFREDPNAERKNIWSIGVYDSTGNVISLGDVASHTDKVDPRKIQLGSVIEVRFQIVNGKFVAQFIVRARRDKLASECSIAQLPSLERSSSALS
jgi:ATP-dependent DNA ligase